MDIATKLIGGMTGAILLAFGGATVGVEAWANEETAPRLVAEELLDLTDPFAAAEPVSGPEDTALEEIALQDDTLLPSEAQAEQAHLEAEARLAADPFVIKRILPIEGAIRYGEWFWDESGAPATGELIMTVDLQARVLSVFRDGYEIGAAAVLLGTQEHPTPLGAFPILTKEKDNVSEKYNNAPMPWTLRLTWDGVAIHGSQVENGYASHGCVGAPDEFAEKLFAIAKKGDVVIITDGRFIGVGDSLVAS
jgi:hypothetical protein